MGIIDEYKYKAIVGFEGAGFYEAIYKGDKYLAIVDDVIFILSNEKLSAKSETEAKGFATEIDIKKIDDLYLCKMYAKYRGNIYEVYMVGPGLCDFELIARKGHDEENEDSLLGFKFDPVFRYSHLLVKLSDIEDIFVEKKSVYEEIKKEFLG